MGCKLLVKSFDENKLLSRCKVISHDEIGYLASEIWIDLTVNADFHDMPEKNLVGKTVTVDKLQTCEYIGVGVKICD